MRIIACVAAIACFAAVLVLPGAGLRYLADRVRRRPSSQRISAPVTVQVCEMSALSILFVAGVGYLLLATRLFAAGTLAVCLLPFSALGLISFLPTLGRLAHRWRAVVPVLGVAAPFAYPALLPGHVPQNNFTWFYWDLGKALSAVHGIPRYVMEYGRPIRWQPDYLSFNVIGEAYRGMMTGLGSSDGTALDAFKVPVALFTVALTWAALRLWFSSTASLVGLVLLSASHVFTTKLGNARPEILGFAIGLLAVVLGVRALRTRSWRPYLLAAAVLAVDSSVHAIGGLVAALFLVAVTLMGLIAGPDRRGLLRTVGGSVVLLACIVVATGWALQGRVFVGADAGHPTAQRGTDPTLLYFHLTEGTPSRPNFVHLLGLRLRDVFRTWQIGVAEGWALVALLALAIVTAVALGPRRIREGTAVALFAGAFLTAGIAWFALRYSTYVPQNTGLSRFVQWSPVVYVLVVVAALDALLHRARVILRRHAPRTVPRLLALPLVVLCSVGAAWIVESQSVARIPIDAAHERALSELAKLVHPGDVVLSNANTHGLFEFFTDAEAPLEGRQPVIEKPAILDATNTYLQAVTRYFEHPAGTDPAREFNASWLVTTDRVAGFGASFSFGPRQPRIPSGTGITLVWRDDGTSIYHAAGAHPVRRTGPAEALQLRGLGAEAGVLVVAYLLCVWLARERPSVARQPVA